ncbi:MAG: hypothetical protein A2902_01225 [Elusimicrobia bacterium RIFCSPLOWO2_01_FULL_64_13]|nr:MAG: hypothetical protein A2636_00690 [Elusimicrobia bacterium RIFCSPHIGHO2_01_FULL_64_10]OGR97908.1 MAG: hypothetical protein A2902_01225 [Elusimicrobia bacterium RIFCSPLOWO2_01_FULL_64_13]
MTVLRLHQLNDVKLVGRLTRDPELRFTGKGQPICRFDLAVNRRFRDPTGEWKDDTSFVPVVVWGDSGQRCADRLTKGSPVYVEGRLKSRSWESKDGQKRSSLEVNAQRIQFLAKVQDASAGPPADRSEGFSPSAVPQAEEAAVPSSEGPDEDIPF